MANGAVKKWLPVPRWMGHALAASTVIMAGLVLWCYRATLDVPLFRKYFEGDLLPRNMSVIEVVLWPLLYLPGITLLSAGVLALGWLPFHGRFPNKLLLLWAALLTITLVASPVACGFAFVAALAQGRWGN